MFSKIKSAFSFKKKYDNIFFHIPKCGGSSFIGLLKETYKDDLINLDVPTHLTTAVGKTKIEHVNFKDKDRRFKAFEIFNNSSTKNDSECNYFLLARNPIDRLFSEFNFQYHILDGKNGNPSAAIISNLKKTPHSFENYILNKEVQNYQCKFLLGRKIADPNPINEAEFNKIINTIEQLKINLGLTEYFENFLNTFSAQSGVKLNSTFLQRKKTPAKYKKQISNELCNTIKELNDFDFKLYNYIKDKIKIGNEKQLIFKVNKPDKFIA